MEKIQRQISKECSCQNKVKIMIYFAKLSHNSMKSDSNQDWRMISADSSKTSLNGKIKILKGAKDSSGSFFLNPYY